MLALNGIDDIEILGHQSVKALVICLDLVLSHHGDMGQWFVPDMALKILVLQYLCVKTGPENNNSTGSSTKLSEFIKARISGFTLNDEKRIAAH